METVNVHEAKTHLSRLLERVEQGEKITIARAGLPIAVLSRFEPEVRPPRVPGSAKGLFTVPDDFNDPMPEFDGWEPHPLDPLRDL
jgi:antitoxin (DNA-binding transcriptional repressor) of toxin-antitoxin stability system